MRDHWQWPLLDLRWLNRFVLVGLVGRLIGVDARLENGTGCGSLRLPPFLVGSGEKFLEVGPGLDVRCLESPEHAVVIEETGLEHDLKSNFNNLGRGVGRVSCGGVVNRILYLIDQGFERLIVVVGSTKSLVIVLECGNGNARICRIQIV